MKIINTEKLNKCGYQTSDKKNIILPTQKKSYRFTELKNDFLIEFNNYDEADREFVIKQKLKAEMIKLSAERAITL